MLLLIRTEKPGQPLLFDITTGPLALPVFTSRETLARFTAEFKELAAGTKPVKIIDQEEFLSSIPNDVLIVADVRRTETGTVRYLQITYGEKSPGTT